MRRSLRDGEALFLMVTRLSSDSFLETPPLCSTLRLIGTWLALARGHHFLLGSCFEVCHHWRCWFSAYFGGVWSFPLSFFSSEHYFCSTSVDTLPQAACWSNGLQEAHCGSADLAWQQGRREHALWVPTWLVPFIRVPGWLLRQFCGFGGAMGILSVLGLPSGLLWRSTTPFTIRSYQFCCSSSSECLTLWCLFHSRFTFQDH